MKVELYAHGELPQGNQKTVFSWLKKDQMKNENLYRTQQCQGDLIRQLMARQDRQGKWIVFLLINWLFSLVFICFGVLVLA